jgi:hypothetical protein
MQARHLFCPICGVQAFYIPRSNPDGVAVTVNCASEDLLQKGIRVNVIKYDGVNWETAYKETGIESESRPANWQESLK